MLSAFSPHYTQNHRADRFPNGLKTGPNTNAAGTCPLVRSEQHRRHHPDRYGKRNQHQNNSQYLPCVLSARFGDNPLRYTQEDHQESTRPKPISKQTSKEVDHPIQVLRGWKVPGLKIHQDPRDRKQHEVGHDEQRNQQCGKTSQEWFPSGRRLSANCRGDRFALVTTGRLIWIRLQIGFHYSRYSKCLANFPLAIRAKQTLTIESFRSCVGIRPTSIHKPEAVTVNPERDNDAEHEAGN